MAYVIVFFAALVSGALVYWLTLRAGRLDHWTPRPKRGGGFLRLQSLPAATAMRPPRPVGEDAQALVRVAADGRSWQTRTVRVLGPLIAVTLAAALLAFSLYQGGSLVAKLISDYAS